MDIQWLRQLGRVTHEYAKQWMEFEHDGKVITLKGSEFVSAKKISFNKLQALLLSEDDIYGVYELYAYHADIKVDSDIGPSGRWNCQIILLKF